MPPERSDSTTRTTGSYAKVSGLNLYDERSGEAQQAPVPLILLHGSFETTSEFAHLVPALSAGREVTGQRESASLSGWYRSGSMAITG